MATLHLPVLYGTEREGRKSIRVAEYVHRRLANREGVSTQLVDPRDLPLGNLRRRVWRMDPPPRELEDYRSSMERADGFVIVTPEYNFGYPGALKNMLDFIYDEWNRKPFALVGAAGRSGGLRCLDQLRQVIAGLDAVVVPRHASVARVGDAFTEEGEPADPEAGWGKRFDDLLEELEWYARALGEARQG